MRDIGSYFRDRRDLVFHQSIYSYKKNSVIHVLDELNKFNISRTKTGVRAANCQELIFLLKCFAKYLSNILRAHWLAFVMYKSTGGHKLEELSTIVDQGIIFPNISRKFFSS